MGRNDSELNLEGVNEILEDSGILKDIVYNLNLLTSLQQDPEVQSELQNGSRMESNQQNMLSLQVEPELITLNNVYYIPELIFNIKSCSRLD